MKLTRRAALKLAAAGTIPFGIRAAQNEKEFAIGKGPFDGTRESLRSYQIPEWFRDAKFGMWAHWGPQSAAEDGDWYARNIYIQNSPQYKFHVDHYGHPSKQGFRAVIPTWKAADFDPEYLVSMYKKTGAKYFVSMGVHHDNFDLWNSKYQDWNSVKMGPKKDVVGLFHKAALNNGLKFGVSEHLWISWKWFAVSHLSDKTGPLAGVPYDGNDPQYEGLYHEAAVKAIGEKFSWDDKLIPESWKQKWFLRIRDLVDKYQPDLLYTDGGMPFEEYGSKLVSHLYNSNARKHGGVTQAVYTSKNREDSAHGTCVLDVERGVVDAIWPTSWQTDTCIGNWHYKRDIRYKTPKTVVDLLVDIVSRNGNLLLNVPLPNSGRPDDRELSVVADLTKWMAVNSEGIYGTRPWKIFGEGPSLRKLAQPAGADSKFNESKRKDLTAEDIRYTTKGDAIYAFVMGVPEKEAVIPALGTKSPQLPGKIVNVELLGSGKMSFQQNEDSLRVSLPETKPAEYAVALKVYRS
jgi:alpha-L-fucosidase